MSLRNIKMAPNLALNSQITDIILFFSCVLKEACLTDDLTAHRNNNVDALIREAAEQSTCPDTGYSF